MIVLATLRDKLVDGQRRAAGKKLRSLSVIALDRYNVVLAGAVGDNPLSGKSFFANFRHLANVLSKEEIKVACPQLHESFMSVCDNVLLDSSIANMNDKLNLGDRDKTGALKLYIKLKAHGCEDGDG